MSSYEKYMLKLYNHVKRVEKTQWFNYLNLFICGTLSPYFYTLLNLGTLVPQLSLKGEPEACIKSRCTDCHSECVYIYLLSYLLQSNSYDRFPPNAEGHMLKKIAAIHISNNWFSQNQFINIIHTSETITYKSVIHLTKD